MIKMCDEVFKKCRYFYRVYCFHACDIFLERMIIAPRRLTSVRPATKLYPLNPCLFVYEINISSWLVVILLLECMVLK